MTNLHKLYVTFPIPAVHFEMYNGEVQSVLRCELCNKPFDRESTLKRHGYYCRSRKIGNTLRTRSCLSCAKSKARCDNKRPACSRCVAKGFTCQYPAKIPNNVGRIVQNVDGTSNKRRMLDNSTDVEFPNTAFHQEPSNEEASVLDGTLIIPDAGFENLGGDYLDWFGTDIDFNNLLDLPVYDKSEQYFPTHSASFTRDFTPLNNQAVQLQTPIPSPNFSIPEVPFQNSRALIKRPKLKKGARRTSKLIFHTLKSYLVMMLRQNTLPPFIHPSLLSFKGDNKDMEPLVNCMSLMHMISSGIQGSRKLFWRNVRLECQHFCNQYHKLNKWELLAAMQALSIYILVRLDEGDTEDNNFDHLLITSVTVIAKQLAANRNGFTHSSHSAYPDGSLKADWEAWMFEESVRRLCVIYQIVDKLVYFEPAAMCDLPSHLILAPLPARKQLWEAGDESSWQAENEKISGPKSDFGLAANGDLVKLEEDMGRVCLDDPSDVTPVQMSSEDGFGLRSSSTDWEEWCSGMDGLGGLVMLTASLIE